MSVWTTKGLGRDRDYIVIKHNLPNVNNNIMGVKFRGGYAVVEANSKTYYQLKKVPILRNFREFPITFLQGLPFITRSADVKLVFGVDVYNVYMAAVMKEKAERESAQHQEQETAHLESDKCHFRYTEGSVKGQLCKSAKLEQSPSGYCFKHLLFDPKIDIKTTVPITKADRAKLAAKILKDIQAYIKSE